MDVGVQRESWDYWVDCYWVICRKWIASFIGTLLFTLLAMVAPAQAAIESAPPISGGTTWNNNQSASFPSAEAACLGLINPYTYVLFYTSDKYAFMGTVPNLAYPSVWQDCVWTYLPTGVSVRGERSACK